MTLIKKNLLTIFLLFIILILSFFLRVYELDKVPGGFHIDEASLGYNGYSLLLTGKDENNNKFPLYIDMFGDQRPSGYHYLTIIPIMAFGLTEFATRFPGALFGSITVLAMFFLVNTIFKNKTVGLLSALLIAVSPWHIVLSRASAEAIVALFFIITGFGLFFYSLQRQKILYLLTGMILVSISFLFYHTPRVFVPGLLLVFILIFFSAIKKSSKNYKIAVFLSFVFVFMVSVFLVFGVSGGTGRFEQVNILTSFETSFFQEQQIQEDAIAGSNIIQSRFFHNNLTNTALIFVSNYFDYFGINFLFTTGGLPAWYSIPRIGLLYLIELPFILIGAYYLIKEKNIYSKIPLVWLLIAPIVPAITMDDIPNINRAVVMFPMLNIIAAVGFLSFLKSFKHKKQITAMIGAFFLINVLYFLHQYFYNARIHKPLYRNNGFSEMMKIVNENYNNYGTIVMTKSQGGIYPLVLFYSKYNPKTYQKEGSPKNEDYGGFGKFIFVPQDCPSTQRSNEFPNTSNMLFIDRGDCVYHESLNYKKIQYIYREDGTEVFRIVYDKLL